MAREYPRFIFSNPQNTKSKGPFIVHLLEPRLVFRVKKLTHPNSTTVSYSLVPLDKSKNEDHFNKIQNVWKQAEIWLQNQINKREIIITEKGVELSFTIPEKNIYKGSTIEYIKQIPINPNLFKK